MQTARFKYDKENIVLKDSRYSDGKRVKWKYDHIQDNGLDSYVLLYVIS